MSDARIGDDLPWHVIQALPTGDLIHLMFCNFNNTDKNEMSYMQNESYMAAAEELNKRVLRQD